MKFYVPVFITDHDVLWTPDILPKPETRIYSVEELRNFFADVMNETKIFNIAVPTNEYVSNSGLHEVVFTFPPSLQVWGHDIYTVRVILTYHSIGKTFNTIEELADHAFRNHEDEVCEAIKEHGIRKIGYIAWKISRGFDVIMIVEPLKLTPVFTDDDIGRIEVAMSLMGRKTAEELVKEKILGATN